MIPSNTRLLLQSSALLGAVLLMRQRHLAAQCEHKTSKPDLDSRTPQNLPTTSTASKMEPLSLATKAPALVKTELAVKMHCESCAKHVRGVLENQAGVTNVEVDLPNETVVVTGNFVVSDIVSALTKSGREARVVGRGATQSLVPPDVGSDDEWGAAVGEFKGKFYGTGDVHGVVRIVQLDPDQCAVESELSGLNAGKRYAWHVHEFGDLRSIPKTTGKRLDKALLGEGEAQSDGTVKHSAVVPLHVWELIGRSIVLYSLPPNGNAEVTMMPLCGTVIARSAGIGANSGKRLCTCDGTVIWEAKY